MQYISFAVCFIFQTAIIATVAPGAMCSMESSSTLKYAERARSALNSTQLSKTQVLEAKLSRLSQLYKELQAEFQQERDSMEREKLAMKLAHAQEVHMQQVRHEQQVPQHSGAETILVLVTVNITLAAKIQAFAVLDYDFEIFAGNGGLDVPMPGFFAFCFKMPSTTLVDSDFKI